MQLLIHSQTLTVLMQAYETCLIHLAENILQTKHDTSTFKVSLHQYHDIPVVIYKSPIIKFHITLSNNSDFIDKIWNQWSHPSMFSPSRLLTSPSLIPSIISPRGWPCPLKYIHSLALLCTAYSGDILTHIVQGASLEFRKNVLVQAK